MLNVSSYSVRNKIANGHLSRAYDDCGGGGDDDIFFRK